MKLSKKQGLMVFGFLVVWVSLTIPALTWGVLFDWPDNVHVNHGFPFVWATHTLNTVAGPVDIWHVDITALLMDLILWLGLMTATVAITLYVFIKRT